MSKNIQKIRLLKSQGRSEAEICAALNCTFGEVQRTTNFGMMKIEESSRATLNKGHYHGLQIRREEQSASLTRLRKMHNGSGEPPLYSLARSMMKKGYLPEEIVKLLQMTRQELSKALIPDGV